MKSFEEALKIVMNYAAPLDVEEVGVEESLQRILAVDIRSDIDMPPFNKSAMDGFACRKEDLQNHLKVIETIPAGKIPERRILANQCSKIMTGAMLPEGADRVVKVENTEQLDPDTIRILERDHGSNICYLGEDIRMDDVVIEKGTLIQPQQIAILASVGVTIPLVYKRPLVGIISTGDELVEPDVKPGRSQIRNSNAFQLVAQVKATGAIPDYLGIASDSEKLTEQIIRNAISKADVIVLTGGVSMGDFDMVPDIMTNIGIKLEFKSIAIQPGRPTVFGVKDKKLCFGLPGNPVSSFTLFELLVKPALFGLMGYHYEPAGIYLPMGSDYSRKRSSRRSYLPVKISPEGSVIPVAYHGSAHINALNQADGLIAIPIGETRLLKGEKVHVRLI